MAVEARPEQLGLDFKKKPRAEATTLTRSPLTLRLAALEKERVKLLASIERKKVALDASLEHARRLAQEVFNLVQPLRERALGYAREIVDLFGSLLGPKSRLNTRDKRKVKALYDDLREGLALDELIEACEGQPGPAGGESGTDTRRTGSRLPGGDVERGLSATKPTGKNAASVTTLFRKLALALHPDRVREESEKTKRTELMREVTRAYEQGDLARLLHLQQVWLERGDAPSADGEQAVSLRIEELTLTNQQLRRQLRLLRKEEKSIRGSSPGAIDELGRFTPAPELQGAVADMERELARLDQVIQFTRRFEAGAVTLQEFCAGPDLDSSDEFGEYDEEHLDELLIEFLEEGLLEDFMQDLRVSRGKAGKQRKQARRSRRRRSRSR
jgi:hypothetical protein